MFPLLPAEAHGGALNRTGCDGLRGSYAHVACNCPCLCLVGCFSIRGVLHLAEGRASQRSTWQRVRASHSPKPLGCSGLLPLVAPSRRPQCLNQNRYPLLPTNFFYRPTSQAGTLRPSRAGPGTSLSRTTFPRSTDASPPCYARATCSPRARYASPPSIISQ